MDNKQFLFEQDVLLDAYRLGVQIFNAGLNVDAVIRRLRDRLKKNMPDNIRVASLWYKPAQNRTHRKPDFFMHETDDWLVLPCELCGLTSEELSRHKSFVLPLLAKK